MDMNKCNSDNGDVFDVWVSRDHLSSYGSGSIPDYMDVFDATKTGIIKVSGCCYFKQTNQKGDRKRLPPFQCKALFDFLPRPGELWNFWSTGDGTLYYTEHRLWLDGKVGKDYKKVEHKSEKKWYL